MAEKTDKATFRQNHPYRALVTGSAASCLSRLISQPLDVVKFKLQLQRTPIYPQEEERPKRRYKYHSIMKSTQLIVEKEGIRGLWRGHRLAQVQGFFQGMVLFASYEQIYGMLRNTAMGTMPVLCRFPAGFMSGTLIVMTLNPLDMLRARVIGRRRMAGGKVISIRQATREIYNTGGWRAFYKGATTSMMHFGTLLGAKFLFYDLVCDGVMLYQKVERHKDLSGLTMLMAGAVSGFLANVVSYPLDLTKRRLQMHYVDGPQHFNDQICSKLFQCMHLVRKTDGVLGLFKGFWPCSLKSIISTAVQFGTYDILRTMIDRLLDKG